MKYSITRSNQLFEVFRAIEEPPLTTKELRHLIWEARPNSEWGVREISQEGEVPKGFQFPDHVGSTPTLQPLIHKMDKTTTFKELLDKGDNVERCLAIMWLDAHDRLWPKQNTGQRMYLVESAIDLYIKVKL